MQHFIQRCKIHAGWPFLAFVLIAASWILSTRVDDGPATVLAACPPCKELKAHQSPPMVECPKTPQTECNILNNPLVDNLRIFSANSANDDAYKGLWFIGAKSYIPMVNELLELVGYRMKVETCDNFDSQDDFTNKLAALFNHYGSDKATRKPFHIIEDLRRIPFGEK